MKPFVSDAPDCAASPVSPVSPVAGLSTQHEGIARVVAVEAGGVWLEPIQSGGCSGCSAAHACGSKGIGTVASRLEAKRFFVPAEEAAVGEQLAVTFGEQGIVGAAALAYAVPLLFSIAAAVFAQSYAGSDLLTLGAAVAGLLLGFAMAKFAISRRWALGGLQPRVVRHAGGAAHFPEGT